MVKPASNAPAVSLADIRWQWFEFSELNVYQLHDLLALRQQVFIVEQECPYLDTDGKDIDAWHLMGWHNEKLVATLRFFESYADYEGRLSIGRVCTEFHYRHFGLGKELLRRGLAWADEKFPEKAMQIGAQNYLHDFYQQFGFKQSSPPYLEDGIEHILMVRE